MICVNSGNIYVHANCERLEISEVCMKCKLPMKATEKTKSATFAGKQGMVHEICYNKKRKIVDVTDIYIYISYSLNCFFLRAFVFFNFFKKKQKN